MIHDQTYHNIDIQYQISHFIFTIPEFLSLYFESSGLKVKYKLYLG